MDKSSTWPHDHTTADTWPQEPAYGLTRFACQTAFLFFQPGIPGEDLSPTTARGREGGSSGIAIPTPWRGKEPLSPVICRQSVSRSHWGLYAARGAQEPRCRSSPTPHQIAACRPFCGTLEGFRCSAVESIGQPGGRSSGGDKSVKL